MSTPFAPHSGPRPRYEAKLKDPGFTDDGAQRRAVDRLQQLYEQLRDSRRAGWLRWLQRRRSGPPKGVYLWGGVGRGKTFLMDMLYESLPPEGRLRTHFHRFMRRVHEELTRLKGEKNPLELVADSFASEADVICFDEFFVADITDAMILANLLQALFDRGVILVATSNIEPQGLYKDGLQRARFLPAIELLLQHMDVINVDSGTDYRLRTLSRVDLFYSPLNRQSAQSMQRCFDSLVSDAAGTRSDVILEIEHREMIAKREADDIVWFDFQALCDGPRSQHDYIVLAREYHTVLISGVPRFDGRNDDQARRFIYLVDEFYDRAVKLIISAEHPIGQLYRNGHLQFEFGRTVSRLQEMQSREYLARPHRP